jgi:uncharacterized membrane protein YfcA
VGSPRVYSWEAVTYYACEVDTVFAGFSTQTLALGAFIVLFGGLVKGTVGFGYAIASTAVLATMVDPLVAVTVIIVPTLAANLTLLRSLDAAGLRSCLVRFSPFLVAAVGGTFLGMALLGRVDTRPLTTALGGFTLAYATFKQDVFVLPGESRLRAYCFRPGTGVKLGYGAVAGLIFGASNVAVQVVAYLDGLDLDRSTFVGVLAMMLVGVSTVRVGAAAALGLYGSTDLFALSLVAVVPGLFGVALGGRLRERLPERVVELGVVVLLAAIGLRLLAKGVLGV